MPLNFCCLNVFISNICEYFVPYLMVFHSKLVCNLTTISFFVCDINLFATNFRKCLFFASFVRFSHVNDKIDFHEIYVRQSYKISSLLRNGIWQIVINVILKTTITKRYNKKYTFIFRKSKECCDRKWHVCVLKKKIRGKKVIEVET